MGLLPPPPPPWSYHLTSAPPPPASISWFEETTKPGDDEPISHQFNKFAPISDDVLNNVFYEGEDRDHQDVTPVTAHLVQDFVNDAPVSLKRKHMGSEQEGAAEEEDNDEEEEATAEDEEIDCLSPRSPQSTDSSTDSSEAEYQHFSDDEDGFNPGPGHEVD